MAYETSWYFIFFMRPWPKKLHVSVNLNQTKEKNIQNFIIARLIIFGEGGGGDPMIFVYSMKHLK
jgi:hypothetical protein